MSYHPFKPRARLLLQLGDQLIRNESVALLELVKNGYDAGSELVEISMAEVHDKAKGKIVVTDYGKGMSLHTVEHVWMEIGTDFQLENLLAIEADEETSQNNNSSGNVPGGHNRKPLGEKGIGRFGAHKLGDRVELVTKAAGEPEIFLELDWSKIKKDQYLDEFQIDIKTRTDPEVFTEGATGTRITINGIREVWSRTDIRQVYRSVLAMCSPFQKPDAFRVDFTIDDPDILRGLPTLSEMLEEALYSFDCTVKGGYITAFRYTFRPFVGMTRVRAREIVYPAPTPGTLSIRAPEPVPVGDRNIERSLRLVREEKDPKTKKKELIPLDLSEVGVGGIRFQGYIFDLDPKTIEFGHVESKSLRDYMKDNGGVRVYRDGVRVYDYGEPGNDWLNLQGRRVAKPGRRVDDNLLLATVELDRSSSKALVEKTNREGFIENNSFETLVEVVVQCLTQVENYRFEDKERIRLSYGVSNRKERTPLLDRIEEARELIERKVQDPTDRQELRYSLMRVEDDYQYLSKTLLTSAGAGMQLSLAVHEIEKITDELVRVTNRDPVPPRLKELIQRLSKLVEGYKTVLRRGTKKRLKLKDLIDIALTQVDFRLEVHNIQVVNMVQSNADVSNVNGIENLIIMGILNLIDNSIYWLEYAKIGNKQMYFGVIERRGEGVSLIVADNGDGFNLPSDVMIRPFISKRPEGSGLGLYLLDEIMTIHGGTLTFPEATSLNLPSGFERGAVASLNFPTLS